MNEKNLAKKLLQRDWDKLNGRERKIIEALFNRAPVSHDVAEEFEEKRTIGEKIADRVAKFGGSWTFILLFGGILVCWVILNTFLLANRAFDPYPYILLNLFLSMIAALQAPIIMMSQNRAAARDRLDATHDYEVNLKAELEIRQLQEKLDELRDTKWAELVEMQQQQIRLLEKLLRDHLEK